MLHSVYIQDTPIGANRPEKTPVHSQSYFTAVSCVTHFTRSTQVLQFEAGPIDSKAIRDLPKPGIALPPESDVIVNESIRQSLIPVVLIHGDKHPAPMIQPSHACQGLPTVYYTRVSVFRKPSSLNPLPPAHHVHVYK